MVLVVKMFMIGNVWVIINFRIYGRTWSKSGGLSILCQGNIGVEA